MHTRRLFEGLVYDFLRWCELFIVGFCGAHKKKEAKDEAKAKTKAELGGGRRASENFVWPPNGRGPVGCVDGSRVAACCCGPP